MPVRGRLHQAKLDLHKREVIYVLSKHTSLRTIIKLILAQSL